MGVLVAGQDLVELGTCSHSISFLDRKFMATHSFFLDTSFTKVTPSSGVVCEAHG